MTTIATDGITIAADTQMNDNGCIVQRPVNKIITAQGMVFGFSGVYPLLQPMVDWFVNGHDQNHFPKLGDMQGFLWVFDPRGMIYEYHSIAPFPVQLPIPNALGSGSDFALGAMAMGATPTEAVQVACNHDTHTGGQVMTYDYPAINMPQDQQSIASNQGLGHNGESGTQAQSQSFSGAGAMYGQETPYPDNAARIKGR